MDLTEVQYLAPGEGIHSGSWGKARVFVKPGLHHNKADADKAPMIPAVEWIASRLALALGLPVPTGQIGQARDGRRRWVSLVVQLRGQAPAPPDPDEVFRQEPRLATGSLVFDEWIFNNDRHDDNIVFHKSLGLWLIDHDQSLSGPMAEDPSAVLPPCKNIPISTHVFKSYVADDRRHVDRWIRTITQMERATLVDILELGYRSGVYRRSYMEGIRDFLEHRRVVLAELVEATLSGHTGKIDSLFE